MGVATAADENGVDTIVRPGLVNHWNKLQTEQAQPKLRIQPGDRITAVKHSSEYKNMLEQLGKAPRLTLSIERDREHGVLTPVPNLSSAHQKHPVSQIDGLASRQRSLPSLPLVNPRPERHALEDTRHMHVWPQRCVMNAQLGN